MWWNYVRWILTWDGLTEEISSRWETGGAARPTSQLCSVNCSGNSNTSLSREGGGRVLMVIPSLFSAFSNKFYPHACMIYESRCCCYWLLGAAPTWWLTWRLSAVRTKWSPPTAWCWRWPVSTSKTSSTRLERAVTSYRQSRWRTWTTPSWWHTSPTSTREVLTCPQWKITGNS